MDSKPEVTVIANPRASAGRVGRNLARLERGLRGVIGPFELATTTHPGHAGELACELARSNVARRLLVLGGDGTLSEVVNGLLRAGPSAGGVEVGLLPAGTGGDTRRLLTPDAGSRDVLTAAAAAMGSVATAVDVGRARFEGRDGGARERYFVNVLSFGIGGLVDTLVNDAPKHLGGRASFYIGTVRALLRYRPAHVALEIDGVPAGEHRVTNVFVCNGRYGGGGMQFAPAALLDDGLFDVVSIADRSLLRTLTMTRAIYRGTFDRFDGVQRWRGRTIRARTLDENEATLDLDGEAPGRLPLEVTLIPAALRLLGVRPEVLSR